MRRILRIIKGQQELIQCKKGLFSKERRKVVKDVKNTLRELEVETSVSDPLLD